MGDEFMGSGEMSEVWEVTGPLRDAILAKIAPPQRPLPFVWEVTHKNITSYAIGTKHNEPKVYTTDITRLLNNGIKGVFIEITPTEPTPEQVTKITRETAQTLDNYLNLCKEDTTKMKVIDIISRLQGYYTPNEILEGKMPGVDGNIIEVANALGIPTYSLETHEERLPFLRATHQDLRNLITLAEALPKLVPRMLEEMEKGLDRAEKSYQSGEHTYRKTPTDRLLTERNTMMAYRSLERLVEEPTLIAAGLNHFIGPEPTMLTLYQEKGINVKRI